MGRIDAESETLIAAQVPDPIAFHPTQDPISSTDGTTHAMGCGSKGGQASIAVAVTGDITHALNTANNGKGCSEDGTGRGVPTIAFSCKDYGADAGDLSPTLRSMGHDKSHPNAGGQVAVVTVSPRGREGGGTAELGDDRANALRASSGGGDKPHVLDNLLVRRLTPRECERLQGFPDDHTDIRPNGKPTPDGPRYKAVGNSWAVPVVRWIGRRIDLALRGGFDL